MFRAGYGIRLCRFLIIAFLSTLVSQEKLFTFAQYSGARGHSRKLFKRRHRLNSRGHSFFNRVVDVWNSLPDKVVLAPSLNTFQSRHNQFCQVNSVKLNSSCYIPGQRTGGDNHIEMGQ